METTGDVKLTLVRCCLKKVDGGFSYDWGDFYSKRESGSSHDASTQTFEWEWKFLKDNEVELSGDKYPLKIDHIFINRDELRRTTFHQRIPSRLCKSTQTGEEGVHKEESHCLPVEMRTSKKKRGSTSRRVQRPTEILTLAQFRARLGLPVSEEDLNEAPVDLDQYRNVPTPEVVLPVPNERGEIPQPTLRGDIVMYKLCRND